MKVVRIKTETGSRIEPRFDPGWDDLTQLQWLVAVTELDCPGLRIEIYSQAKAGEFGLIVGPSSSAPFTRATAWNFLNGVSVGWRART